MINFNDFLLKEDLKYEHKYKCVVVKCDDIEIFNNLQLYLFDNGYKWVTGSISIIRLDPDEFPPMYIFINLETKKFFKSAENQLNGSPNKSTYERILLTAKNRAANDNINDFSQINPSVVKFHKFKEIGIDFFKNKNLNKPSYKPRKINKLNEGVASEVRVWVENIDDVLRFEDELHKIGYTWPNGVLYEIRDGYISKSEKTFVFYLENRTFDTYSFRADFADITLLEYPKNRIRILHYLKTGNLKHRPSYEPRKILKESTKSYPYRFKTEQELIDEYGKDWVYDSPINNGPGWHDDMNIMLGNIFPFHEHELNFDNPFNVLRSRERYNDFYFPNSWVIPPCVLTKSRPSYKPRKIIK